MSTSPIRPRQSQWPHWIVPLAEYLGLIVVLGLLILIFGVSTRNFLTVGNFRTIASQTPAAILIATGMTYVLIIAGIDLSVGSVLALCSAVLGVFMVQLGASMPLAVMACLGTGLLCGLMNGVVTIRWALPSFIVTLGMLEVARGAAYLVTGSRTLYIGSSIERIADAQLIGVSLPFLLAFLIVVTSQWTLSRTAFGRYMVAIGTNEEVVRLSGVDTRLVKLAVFALCGLLTSLAAVIDVSRLSATNPNAGAGAELQAIAAVVIGGTSLMGGRGSVVSSFLGVLIIAVLGNGLAQVGASEPLKRLITGAVIVLAVILDQYRSRMAARRQSSFSNVFGDFSHKSQ